MSDKKENQSNAIETEKSVVTTPEKNTKKGNDKPVPPVNQNDNLKEEAIEEVKNTSETLEKTQEETMTQAETPAKETVIVKKGGGTAIALLALLVALGVGGAGYYFGQMEVDKINQKVTALEDKFTSSLSSVSTLAAPIQAEQASVNFEQERAQIEKLLANMQTSDNKLAEIEKAFAEKEQAYNALKNQVNKLASNANAQPSDWLLSEADFLLTNALRKLVLDNDVDTSISLLKVADEVLSQVNLAEAKTVRAAINQDLKQLLSVNSVDQNAIMQRLSQLANNVDELMVLNVNFGEEAKTNEKISDDVTDWQTNLEKSATSFLNHFIRITPRSENATQALLAPNQDIYLRENIRLRLQIAILAVPRKQNELYKQSLETVAAWIRSYFDTNSETAMNFLKSLDELAEQSIYIEVPNQLASLNALDKLLNKTPEDVKKIEISADKTLTEANEAAAQEIKQAEDAQQNSAPAEAATAPQNKE
ncbi:uroporphyrinogen-III C-methyltransferase [Pasteurellaceae bacterium 22721_9_1]